MGRGPGRETFRRQKDGVRQPSLEYAKRGAMDVMNNDRNTGSPRGQTAKNAGLAAMSVDKVWNSEPEMARESA
jgi:hypothetical protein